MQQAAAAAAAAGTQLHSSELLGHASQPKNKKKTKLKPNPHNRKRNMMTMSPKNRRLCAWGEKSQ
jgi:hypothetical protein